MTEMKTILSNIHGEVLIVASQHDRLEGRLSEEIPPCQLMTVQIRVNRFDIDTSELENF